MTHHATVLARRDSIPADSMCESRRAPLICRYMRLHLSTPIRDRRRAMRIIVAMSALLCAYAPPAWSATLATRIDRAVHASPVGPTSSVYVYEADSGTPIYQYHADRSSIPASNLKLVTASAVLRRLGPNYRFRTRLALRGRQSVHTFAGNLYLVGGGDPSLSTRAFGRNILEGGANLDGLWKSLHQLGVTRITGKLIVVDTFLDHKRYVSTWPAGIAFDQCQALGALTVNHAMPGATLAGTSVRNPAIHAGEALRASLLRHGIRIDRRTVQGTLPVDATTVASLYSPPLHRLVRFMNRYSDNFTAEILLKDLGRIARGAGTTTAGRQEATLQLALMGIDTSAFHVVDGSGLSYSNAATARGLGILVRIAQHDPTIGWALYQSLPSSGISGTLAHRMNHYPTKTRVRAKTGTLRVASALTGTATRLNGRQYGFSVVTSSGAGISAHDARALQDRIGTILVH